MKNNIIKLFDLLLNYKKFFIAYSGGVDSSTLLYILYNLKLKYKYLNLRVIHINHGLKNSSLFWELFCIKQCKKYKIPILVERILNIKKNNIECVLRKIRYNIFLKYILFDEILLTAHHMNDNCETFFLALKRNSLLSGLSSIKEKIIFNNILILRPFLSFDKAYIIKYALKHNIYWVEDKSNYCNNYDRNYLRNKLFPILNYRWNSFIFTIYRISRIFFIQNYILEKKMISYLINCLNLFNIINLNMFNNFDFIYKIFILNVWIKIYLKIDCSLKQIINLIYLINSNKKYSFLKISNLYFVIFKCNLFPISCINSNIIMWNINFVCKLFNNDFFIPNMGNFCIRLPKKKEIVYVVNFTYIKNFNMCAYIVKLFNLLDISIHIRNLIPLVFYNEKLICIGDIFVTNDNKSDKSFFLKWYRS